MPARSKVSFQTKSGSKIVFKAKVRKSPKTKAQLEKRLKKLKSPVMRAMAREKWMEARSRQ